MTAMQGIGVILVSVPFSILFGYVLVPYGPGFSSLERNVMSGLCAAVVSIGLCLLIMEKCKP